MTGAGARRTLPIDLLDRAAVLGSLVCMAHCLALPLLIAALPALSTVLDVPESLHRWVLAFAAPAAVVALIGGRARHGAILPLVLGGAGLVSLAAGALWLGEGPAETVATVGGSVALATAHLANWRLRRTCPC